MSLVTVSPVPPPELSKYSRASSMAHHGEEMQKLYTASPWCIFNIVMGVGHVQLTLFFSLDSSHDSPKSSVSLTDLAL